ncbi:hypothetical protein HDE_08221 [Halotydeus destructor]|nr:hypothetical protein HDE_08221 [Halotydeus destructor]
MISNIANNKHGQYVSQKKCQQFAKWYLDYANASADTGTSEKRDEDRVCTLESTLESSTLSNLSLFPAMLPLVSEPEPDTSCSTSGPVAGTSRQTFASLPASLGPQLPPSAGSRLFFHQQKEIPQLRTWFAENARPTDQQLSGYLRILNQSQLRQEPSFCLDLASGQRHHHDEPHHHHFRNYRGHTAGYVSQAVPHPPGSTGGHSYGRRYLRNGSSHRLRDGGPHLHHHHH